METLGVRTITRTIQTMNELIALEEHQEQLLDKAYKTKFCVVCGNPTTLIKGSTKFRKTCSDECKSKQRLKISKSSPWRKL